MNLRGLFSSRLRLTVDVAVLAAVVVVIVLLTQGSSTYHPSDAQMQAASEWATLVALPASVTADPSDTACMLPVSRCVISDGSTHSLAVDLHADLAAHDGSPGAVSCSGSSACDFMVSNHGVRGNVQVHRLAGYGRRSSVALIEVSGPTPPPSDPLPALTSLQLTPGTLHVRLNCTVQVSSGCQQAAGTFQSHDGVDPLATSWRSRLENSGWLVIHRPCTATGCVVAAIKSLATGGRQFVLVSATLTAHGSRPLSGRLQLYSG